MNPNSIIPGILDLLKEAKKIQMFSLVCFDKDGEVYPIDEFESKAAAEKAGKDIIKTDKEYVKFEVEPFDFE